MSELADLLDACRNAPNAQGVVRAMLREAHQAVDCSAALGWLEAVDPSAYPIETRVLAADLLLKHGRTSAALAWSWGDDPEVMIRNNGDNG